MPLLIHGSNVTTEVGAKPELIINFLITSCGEGEQRAADLGQRVRGDRARALEPGGSRFRSSFVHCGLQHGYVVCSVAVVGPPSAWTGET